MASFSTSTPKFSDNPAGQPDYTPALVSLMILFFMMGFITCLNDILIPVLKDAFDLNYTESMLVQFCFFTAYLVMSIPSGKIVQKLGYKRGMIIGFIGAGIGCLLFYPAAVNKIYPLFLGAFFILASGITLLQVAANPYVSILGKPETASSRLTLTQAFNSVGTTLAPQFGSLFILSVVVKAAIGQKLSPEQIDFNLHQLKVPYIGIAITLFAIALVVGLLKLPTIKAEEVNQEESKETKNVTETTANQAKSAWSFTHLRYGVGGIFAYVGAEVAIGSFLILFMKHYGGLTEEQASENLSYYWGGAMLGRFIGSAILQRVQAGYVLACSAAVASFLLLIAILASGVAGTVAVWSLTAVGLCNSIMFPTIFTLAVRGIGKHTNQGSGYLSTAIFGGAVIPALQGLIADNSSMQISFILPVFCYIYIVWYGLKGHK
jgi:FHS family L-fucose permease-like MFS transporter